MSFKAHEHSIRSLGLMPLLDNSGRRDGSIPSSKMPEKSAPKTNASKYSSVFKFVGGIRGILIVKKCTKSLINFEKQLKNVLKPY